MFRSWWQHVRGRQAVPHRPGGAARRARWRPQVEALEDRSLLAVAGLRPWPDLAAPPNAGALIQFRSDASGLTLTVTAGEAFTRAVALIRADAAWFTASRSGSAPGIDLRIDVDWGDGSRSVGGLLHAVSGNGLCEPAEAAPDGHAPRGPNPSAVPTGNQGAAAWVIEGTHVYDAPGSYPITVMVRLDGAVQFQVVGWAVVLPPPNVPAEGPATPADGAVRRDAPGRADRALAEPLPADESCLLPWQRLAAFPPLRSADAADPVEALAREALRCGLAEALADCAPALPALHPLAVPPAQAVAAAARQASDAAVPAYLLSRGDQTGVAVRMPHELMLSLSLTPNDLRVGPRPVTVTNRTKKGTPAEEAGAAGAASNAPEGRPVPTEKGDPIRDAGGAVLLAEDKGEAAQRREQLLKASLLIVAVDHYLYHAVASAARRRELPA
jgi:hypothetical protein